MKLLNIEFVPVESVRIICMILILIAVVLCLYSIIWNSIRYRKSVIPITIAIIAILLQFVIPYYTVAHGYFNVKKTYQSEDEYFSAIYDQSNSLIDVEHYKLK